MPKTKGLLGWSRVSTEETPTPDCARVRRAHINLTSRLGPPRAGGGAGRGRWPLGAEQMHEGMVILPLLTTNCTLVQKERRRCREMWH